LVTESGGGVQAVSEEWGEGLRTSKFKVYNQVDLSKYCHSSYRGIF